MNADTWLFGYGSLIWKPELPFVERVPACLRGWVRRFYQASPDHRGTPEAPGRVVTLVPDEAGCCWGVAYRIDAADAREILAALDKREEAGYRRQRLGLWRRDGTPLADAVVYVARPDNPSFAGPAPIGAIAAVIRHARGPSGTNREYVLRLAAALGELGIEDEHVFALAEAVDGADRCGSST